MLFWNCVFLMLGASASWIGSMRWHLARCADTRLEAHNVQVRAGYREQLDLGQRGNVSVPAGRRSGK